MRGKRKEGVLIGNRVVVPANYLKKIFSIKLNAS
jgi:hypothetical protein